MTERKTLADKAFAIHQELVQVETQLRDKACVGLSYDPSRPEQWPFENIFILTREHTIIFELADESFELSKEQQNMLWEMGFIEAIIEYVIGEEVYKANIDGK